VLFRSADDAAVLAWCYEKGRRPSDDEIHYFNAFMTKRGWRDDGSEKMKASKEKRGIAARDDIQTHFDLYDFDEGRK
jgi:gluconokinase